VPNVLTDPRKPSRVAPRGNEANKGQVWRDAKIMQLQKNVQQISTNWLSEKKVVIESRRERRETLVEKMLQKKVVLVVNVRLGCFPK
jgi:hypothetical protein